jgi:elongation factor 1 alpha-like protein
MSGTSTPVRRPLGTEKPDQQLLDLAGLNLQIEEPQIMEEEIPKITLAREKLVEEVAKALQTGVEGGKKGVNLVVIGAVPTYGRTSSSLH